jgi:ComF family protein
MLFDFLFPKICVGCGQKGKYICSSCLEEVGVVSSFCPVCSEASIDGVTHFKCQKKLSIDGIVAVWSYRGVIRKAILALKYKFIYDLAKDLAFLSFEFLESNYSLMNLHNVVLIPIPLARKRIRWRGFNQTEILGRLIARHFGWKFSSNLLLRKKFDKPQTGLSREERKKNAKGVFSINPYFQKDLAGNLQAVVFDDVYTTGSTLKEAAKVLKRNGFKTVWGLVLAKS